MSYLRVVRPPSILCRVNQHTASLRSIAPCPVPWHLSGPLPRDHLGQKEGRIRKTFAGGFDS
jgi:hypothetical protein